MKIRICTKILAIFLTAAVVLIACTKEDPDVRLDPKLSTSQVIDIKSNEATVVGFVVAGHEGISERGVCYNTIPAPTIDNNKVTTSAPPKGATFNVTVTGLDYATKYYARAYITNASGTIYGEEISFTTMPVVPTLTTDTVIAKTGTTVTGGGNITNDGKADIKARGICISLAHNPTIDDTIKAHQMQFSKDGNGIGSFTSTISKLKGQTTYYVRAYAKNSAGVGYGQERTVTTPPAIVTLWIAGDFQGWNPSGAKDSLMNTDDDPIVRGYAYISTTGGFKFVSQKNWNGPNYGAGDAQGKISPTGDNLSLATPGYYLFAIDLANMTYTATKTTWGVIGGATAGGWDSDQSMTYSTAFSRWFATIPLTVSDFKFRANSDWGINFGDKPPVDGKLDAGGDNIPVTTVGTYTLMMDLSSPLNYKYYVTKWSITGDAAAGWGVDTDMTPSVDNKWTVTTTLGVGDFKFRANHDWPINLGGTPSALKWGGDNIHVSTAGTYTITLDLVNGTYTIQ